jgi:signal transduction histidine kinase
MESAVTRRVHPLVAIDYRVRILAHLILAIILAALFLERGASPWLWAAVLAISLLWPQVAYFSACRAGDTKRHELGNLLADAFIVGAWVAVSGFSPWPAVTFVTCLLVGLLSDAGIKFSVAALAPLAAGAATAGALTGFTFRPETGALTTGLSIAGLLLYVAAFSVVTNRQARSSVRNVKTIEQQAQQIQVHHGAARQALEEVRAMSEVTLAIGSSLDLAQVLQTVLRQAVALSGSDAAAIFEFTPTTRAFTGVASYGLDAGFLQQVAATPVDPSVGVIRRAVESGKPWQIPDVDTAHDWVFRDLTLAAGFHSLLAAPIPGPNITRGVVVYRRAAGRFNDRVVELLVALATQSRVAIDNARLFEQTERQRVEVERLSTDVEELYRLSTAMQEPLSLKEQLHRVLEGASKMGLIDRIYIWAVDPTAAKLVNLAGAGFSVDEWKDFDGAEIPLTQAGAMYEAYRTGAPLVFNDDHPLPPALRLPSPYSELRAIRTRSFLVVPMIARGLTVGVLAGDNKPSGRPLLPSTVRLLQTFASHAAVAIDNARLFQEIEDKSRLLEAANRHKSEFLASMSHELRTPLNAIIGFSEVLLERMFGELNAKQAEYLTDILTSGRHLLSLINDILDLSKIEAGRMELHMAPFDLPVAMASALTFVRERAVRQGVALEMSVDPGVGEITGDERKLTQVLLNLLSNAIKFTPEGGRVDLGARLAGRMVEVSVRDTGIGIAAQDQARIFDEFGQAGDLEARRREGTGLGLTLAKRFVEMHGGRIGVESELGRGSTFTIWVPITPR